MFFSLLLSCNSTILSSFTSLNCSSSLFCNYHIYSVLLISYYSLKLNRTSKKSTKIARVYKDSLDHLLSHYNDPFSYHIEASQFISWANKLTGFYIVGRLVVHGFNWRVNTNFFFLRVRVLVFNRNFVSLRENIF